MRKQPAGAPLLLGSEGFQPVEQIAQTFVPLEHLQTTSGEINYFTTLPASSLHPDNHSNTFDQTTSADSDATQRASYVSTTPDLQTLAAQRKRTTSLANYSPGRTYQAHLRR